MLATIFKPKSDAAEAPRPAAAALVALRERIAALQAEDETWGEKETALAKEVRDHDTALAERQRLEEQRLDWLAQAEISGGVPLSMAELEQRLEDARARELRLAERRRIADRVLAHVRTERQRIRTEVIRCQRDLPVAVHAVIREHVLALAPEFLRAEQAYLEVLAKVFGATRLADTIARAHYKTGGGQLGWMGELNVANIFTPRPDAGLESQAFHPVPMRDAIARAIEAEAAALEKAL